MMRPSTYGMVFGKALFPRNIEKTQTIRTSFENYHKGECLLEICRPVVSVSPSGRRADWGDPPLPEKLAFPSPHVPHCFAPKMLILQFSCSFA